MKTTAWLIRNSIGILLLGVAGSTASCEETSGLDPESSPASGELKDSLAYGFCRAGGLESFPYEDLSPEEKEGILYLREEEKLARDSYILFNESHELRNFANIRKSEQAHMDAVLGLIEKYGLEDPAEGLETGVFRNEKLQDLFNTLQKSGQPDKISALKAGALIEETDILDIRRELEENVDNEDVRFVYENLLRGSGNHLRAFVWVLSRNNVEYDPVLLSRSEYLDIIER